MDSIRWTHLSVGFLTLLAMAGAGCRPAIDDNAPEPASDAAGVAGGDLSGTYPNPTIGDAKVTTAKIADGAVTSAKLSQAYLPLAGGTMSGTLVLAGAPSSGLHAATKTYADSYVAGLAIDASGLASISNGQALTWDASNSRWTPTTVVGGANATQIQGTNVDNTAPTANQAFYYNNGLSKWAAGTLPVAGGGTGATTLTSNGMLYGAGTSAVTALAAMTNGQFVVGKTGFAPQVVTMSGDATIDNAGALTIANNAVTAAKIANSTITSTQVSATGGVPTYSVASKTFANTGATLTASETVVLVDASGGATTLTLPAVAGVGAGQVYTFKKTDSSANAVTIARGGASVIDGATSIALYGQYEAVQLVTNGTDWFRLGSAGKIINVTVSQNSARTAIVAAASITLETISVTKKSSTSSLFIQGSIASFGSASGSMTQGWKYGAGAEVVAQALTYNNYSHSMLFPTSAWITGHTTTGAQNLVFRYYAADAGVNSPFLVYNPNATDDARLGQTQSTYVIWEIEP